MIDLDQVIAEAQSLAPLPASAARLAGLIGDPGCHFDDVAEVISLDQALTLKLLRAANSAATAGAESVGTVREAVLRMGAAQVMTLAVAAGSRPLLQQGIPAYDLFEGALWRHSVAAAVAAEVLAGTGAVQAPPEAFTAALLHDVGKLVLGRFVTPAIREFIGRAQQAEHVGRWEAEALVLGVHQAELGGLVAQHWKLPAAVVHGILHQHDPEQGNDAVCDLTFLADQMAKHIEAALAGRGYSPIVSAGMADRLRLDPARIGELGPLVVARYRQLSRRYDAV
jgi:HD-like signal output (HDOD) protein